ncbi:MAG: PPOX class F420-dependent oxidoreductase [Solirubrobacteraceae bacterium]
MARQMSDDEVRAFLRFGTRTGKIATVMKSGAPHVMPIWFVLDGEDIVFTTGRDTVKGRNLRRDPRVSMVVDDQQPPYSFVHVRGEARISEDPDELLRFAIEIGRRYMGDELGEEFGRRNAVPGELLVRVAPTRVIAEAAVSE